MFIPTPLKYIVYKNNNNKKKFAETNNDRGGTICLIQGYKGRSLKNLETIRCLRHFRKKLRVFAYFPKFIQSTK